MSENQSVLRKTMRTVDFFTIYFAKFKYILLSNLLFSVFTLLAAGYVYLTYLLSNGVNILIASAAIIILNVGMGGMAQVCRYIYTGKEFSVAKTFWSGVKENALRCLLHGVIFCILFDVCYSSIALYYSGTKSASLFWVPLVITGLISVLLLFASYYFNIMTVTMELRLKALYRNCALFSFGEIKNNALATFALMIFGAVVFTTVIVFFNALYSAIMAALLSIFIIPSTVQYIITFYVYDDMVSILDESRKPELEEKPKPLNTVIEKSEAKEISEILTDAKDEYIFHNGRMLKRSDVEKQLNDNMSDEY